MAVKKKQELDIPKVLRREPGDKTEEYGIKLIQFYISDTKPVRISKFREFPKFEEALSWIKEYTRLDPVVLYSKDGTTTQCRSGAQIFSNYNVKELLAGNKPKGRLRDISRSEKIVVSATTQPVLNPLPTSSPTAKSKARRNGELIPLKKICSEMKMEPRKARQMLRAAAKKGKMPHSWKGRWEFPPNEVEQVKKLLKV